ncbi:hypothetical protein GCM10027275_05970 [Rhabdobacter roseus]|uniref:Lipoprotein n=1 Tax=Rhabdobacter roseus TaxID=1655419 RepID=A0A840TRZ8_9BACT|nr:hypothetical protein [Rhabdobacter roseus]MBB5282489.1 hypothetical protein [Rhabdobacter roseus]
MKIVLEILLFILLIIGLSCTKLENKSNKSPGQEILLTASQHFSSIGKTDRTLTIFKDSTFNFTETIVEPNYDKIESFKGKTRINNDTIKFLPFKLKHNNAEIAVLKNGFIEFIDSNRPDRMKIKETALTVKNNIDFRNFQDYAVFTLNKNSEPQSNEQDYKSYDLTTSELTKIETILKQTFEKNKILRDFSDYIKQVESVENKNKQHLIFIQCYCKSFLTNESYQYYQIEMSDGGNCNIYIVLNLTTERIEVLNIAGDA